ncbi:MAG: hypothetical protein PHG85_04025 [Candidatus Altiarchaeota archaeon]|nr:hypothetical protein [Candidatus Altiarchaeota archaeon]
MNKNLVAALITIGIGLLFMGFFDANLGNFQACEKPYLLSEGSCCLDSDDNLACDSSQTAGGWGSMKASITYRNRLFNVTNLDDVSWDNCVAEVDGFWTYRCGVIVPGKTFVFDHGDLKGPNLEGVPAGFRPRNITVYSTSGFAFKQLSEGLT